MARLEIIDDNDKFEELFKEDNSRKIPNESVKKTTKEDFENVLTENGEWILLNDEKEWHKDIIREYIYGIILKETDKKYIIWSSIDIRTDKFRDTGCDAIRISRYGTKINGKHIRVNRVDNWSHNLSMKLHDFRTSNKY